MSCRRGGPSKGAPKHKNSIGFKHNKHSKKSQKIAGIQHIGLCPTCHAKIEWRKKYRKYKALKAPRRCSVCQKRTIVRAYHSICASCANAKSACAKCMLPRAQWRRDDEESEEEDGKADSKSFAGDGEGDAKEGGRVPDAASDKTLTDAQMRALEDKLDDPGLRERERRTIQRKLGVL